MNIIIVSMAEYKEKSKELEELVMKKKDAVYITGASNKEDSILINIDELVKILVNSEKANEFAMELKLGNETYEEVLEGIEKEMNDPNAVSYSQEEFEEMLRRRFRHVRDDEI